MLLYNSLFGGYVERLVAWRFHRRRAVALDRTTLTLTVTCVTNTYHHHVRGKMLAPGRSLLTRLCEDSVYF
jgi:hypothetical protein